MRVQFAGQRTLKGIQISSGLAISDGKVRPVERVSNARPQVNDQVDFPQ